DEHPEHDDVREGEAAQVPPEEQPAPERIDRELHQEQRERATRSAKAADTPDQPRRDAHERVQDCPDRAEHVGRWSPLGTRELRIEGPGLYGGGAADRGGNEADREPRDEPDDLLFSCQSHKALPVFPGAIHADPTELLGAVLRPLPRCHRPRLDAKQRVARRVAYLAQPGQHAGASSRELSLQMRPFECDLARTDRYGLNRPNRTDLGAVESIAAPRGLSVDCSQIRGDREARMGMRLEAIELRMAQITARLAAKHGPSEQCLAP